MKADHIKTAMMKTPVKPVQIELDSGRKITLKHPDYVFWNTTENALIITEHGDFEIIDASHITSVKRTRTH